MPLKNPYASAAISVTVAVIAAMPTPVSAYTTTMCNSHQIKNVSGLDHTYSSQPSVCFAMLLNVFFISLS